uniref:Fibronectin type-III domain-containing protein n=1 Tax=Sphenodon punctatus TaxID=8508 RepID=A0A8D0HF22_SPHPU
MVENISARRYDLHHLKPDTEYEVQVSCKFHSSSGIWSDWSVPFITEAVPGGPLDVWYLTQDTDSQTQNITLFWKPSSPLEGRTEILHYRVTFHKLNQT